MGTYAPPQPSGTHYLSLQQAVTDGYGAYSTLRSWIGKGILPAVKIGGRVKVLRTDLVALAVPKSPHTVPESREAALARVLATAPPPSEEQRRRLASILGGAA